MPLDSSRLALPITTPPPTAADGTSVYKPLPSPGAVRRLLAYWFGQRIETAEMSLRVRSLFPTCGDVVWLAYKVRNGHRAELSINDGPSWMVAGRGTIGLRAKGEAIDVSVTDQSAEICGTRIEPHFDVPRLSSLRWRAPPVAGGCNVVSWKIIRADIAFLTIH